MSEVEELACPIEECDQCKDKNGMLHEVELNYDDHHDEVTNKGDIIESNQDHDVTRTRVQFSLDEFHLLHSKHHGMTLKEAEVSREETYSTIESFSTRKSWSERPRGIIKKSKDDVMSNESMMGRSKTEDKSLVENIKSPDNIRARIENYLFRETQREYYSPRNHRNSKGSMWKLNIPKVRENSGYLNETQLNEEEMLKFMIPEKMKNNRDNDKKEMISNAETYIYRKPSTLEPIHERNSPLKSTKKNDKYSHVHSRYNKDIYKPAFLKRRYIISTPHRKDVSRLIRDGMDMTNGQT